jgi:hypothetical protein
MTHTMLWEKGCRGEMLRLHFKLWRLHFKLWPNNYMSSGDRGSPMLDFTQGVVAPRSSNIRLIKVYKPFQGGVIFLML